MGFENYSPATDDAQTLYTVGQQYLDVIDTISPHLENTSASALAVAPENAEYRMSDLPESIRVTVGDDYEEPMDRWVQPDLADWRQQIRTESGEVSEPILYEWVETPDESTVFGVATTVVDILLESTDYPVSAEGMWLPNQSDDNREYYISISSTVSTIDRAYTLTCILSTDGTVETKLALSEYGQTESMNIVSYAHCDAGGERRDENTDISDVLEEAGKEVWARTVLGSHAIRITQRTSLTYTESLVHLLSGVEFIENDSDIADYIGRTRSSVATFRQRAREKFDKAVHKQRKYQRTKSIGEHTDATDMLVAVGSWDID